MKMHVYIIDNYDGRYSVAVAAAALSTACIKAGTTQHQVRQHGYRKAPAGDESVRAVREAPGALFRRPFMTNEPWAFWREAFA